MSKGAFTPAVVEVIWSRDNGSCVICSRGLHLSERGQSWSIHHRSPRGMGGTRLTWVGLPANGVVLCGTGTTGCHGKVESDRKTAYGNGWLVRRNGLLYPSDVPFLYRGELVLLDDEGGITRI